MSISEISSLNNSVGPIFLTPRNPSIDMPPMRNMYLKIENAQTFSANGNGPEGGTIECFTDLSSPGISGSVGAIFTLEAGWRLLVKFKSPMDIEFRWTAIMFGGPNGGETGEVNSDPLDDTFYFTTPVVVGDVPEGEPFSSFSISAKDAPSTWLLTEMNITAIFS